MNSHQEGSIVSKFITNIQEYLVFFESKLWVKLGTRYTLKKCQGFLSIISI